MGKPQRRSATGATMSEPSEAVSALSSFYCELCSCSFGSMRELTRHSRTVHDSSRPYMCSTCGKRFLNRSHHKEHQRVHTGERPFPCTQCERSFTTRHNLRRHVAVHSKEERYRCRDCGVLFCQRHDSAPDDDDLGVPSARASTADLRPKAKRTEAKRRLLSGAAKEKGRVHVPVMVRRSQGTGPKRIAYDIEVVI